MQSLNLKWEKVGWVRIAQSVASFPWPGLPSDVHFSLSYSPNSDFMNLHLSRNLPGVPPDNKPQIRIAQWPKAEFEEMAQIFLYRYWERIWTPFDMQKYQYRPMAKGTAARYCSITRLTKPGKQQYIHRQLKADLLPHFQNKQNGKYLIVKEELAPTAERLMRRPDIFWSIIDQFKRVTRKFKGRTEIGYLYAKDFKGLVLRIQAQWFTYNEDADLASVLQAFLEPDAYYAFKENTRKAITDISTATTRADTASLNQPIGLAIIR